MQTDPKMKSCLEALYPVLAVPLVPLPVEGRKGPLG